MHKELVAGKAKLEYSVHVKTHSLLIDLTKCLPSRKVTFSCPIIDWSRQQLAHWLTDKCFWDLIDVTLADVVHVWDASPGLREWDPENFITFIVGLSNEAERWLAKHVRAGILTPWSEAFNTFVVVRCKRKQKSQRRFRQTAALPQITTKEKVFVETGPSPAQ